MVSANIKKFCDIHIGFQLVYFWPFNNVCVRVCVCVCVCVCVSDVFPWRPNNFFYV